MPYITFFRTSFPALSSFMVPCFPLLLSRNSCQQAPVMLPKTLTLASIAAILATVSAAPVPVPTAPHFPTITACIAPVGDPHGCVDGGGYLRRSNPTSPGDDDSIVIGSKKRSPEASADQERSFDPLPTGDEDGYLRKTKDKREPMWEEGTCGPEEDIACYPDGSNGKRSPNIPEDLGAYGEGDGVPVKRSPLREEDVGAYDEDDGVPWPFKRNPMFPEHTCGPEEDLACYPDGSNGKRSKPVDEIQPQPLPSGKNRRALSLDPDGKHIVTGDNYPPPTKRVPGPLMKLDHGDYPPPDDSGGYIRTKRGAEAAALLDAGIYEPNN